LAAKSSCQKCAKHISPQNTAIGSTIATVAASDLDHGNDGLFSFFIYSGNDDDCFLIDSNSGQIELKRPFDRETTAFYNITVSVVDHGTPNMTSHATVSVTILDVNDNAPNCSQSTYVIQVPENTTINSTMVSLDCDDLDKDSNAELIYNITTGKYIILLSTHLKLSSSLLSARHTNLLE
jgi:hypothetical protein